ncbi:MAG: UDP-N-acetylmuramoyl-L-alanine--D-glutamate ligase [Clostridia bacterium]|nr:UDP-N-acetylmuramoyl-L-alanine--D-glutamate ligase [Clostridia bacterium]
MKTVELIKNRIKNSRCAVLGFGVSNIPLVELLIQCGNEITVHDKKDIEKLGEKAKLFSKQGVRFVTGENYLDNIDADIIFRSPGIRPDYDGIKKAIENGAELTSEMELFLELTPAYIVGVTGSDGKTTTTTIAYKLLEKEFEKTDRKIYVGGNIGTPLLSKVGEMTERDICVLELSSFQLFTMKKSPARALITNLSPNHLDWHKGMDEYVEAKTNIYQHGCSRLTTNANNELCRELIDNVNCEINLFSAYLTLEEMKEICPDAKSYVFLYDNHIYFSNGFSAIALIDVSSILIPGKHNIENYMAAISLLWGMVSEKTEKYIAKTFVGVEHRLELVREFNGVIYINSSIDSSPTRTAAALSALPIKPIVICGGYDKQIPFEPLADALNERAKAVILTGATAEKIYEILKQSNSQIEVYLEKDFKEAVIKAKDIAKKNDIVLLSPACASFDAFDNFMQRGNRFKEIVNDFK